MAAAAAGVATAAVIAIVLLQLRRLFESAMPVPVLAEACWPAGPITPPSRLAAHTAAACWVQFARLIGTREHAEFMWRITKDEAQRSTITQVRSLACCCCFCC